MLEKIKLRNIGINVKIWRLKRNLSQEELAELIDTSRNTISLIENGKINTTILKIIDISNALQINIENLLENI